MIKLTARQTEILELIQGYLEETGFPPTRVEIAQELGFRSPNAAEDHLRALAKKGVIEMIPGASRGIRILHKAKSSGLPIVGQVAAGSPVLAQENIERYCPVSKRLFFPVAHYLLRVKGLSMIKAGILEGDLLAVHKTQDVKNGDIVIARIGDDVTVKRFRKVRTRITLLPENDDFEPITVFSKEDDFNIEGVSVGIIRQGHL